MKKKEIAISKFWKVFFLVLLGVILIFGNANAETYSGGEIQFKIRAPQGGATLEFKGEASGSNTQEMSVNGTVFSIKEQKNLFDENHVPAGEAKSSYSEAKLEVRSNSDQTKMNFAGRTDNISAMQTQFASANANHGVEVCFNGTATGTVNAEVKGSGYTSVGRDESGRYMYAETSSQAYATGNLPVTAFNKGDASVLASDAIGDNYSKASATAGYCTGINTSGLANAQAGTWLSQDSNRTSASALIKAKTSTGPATVGQ